MTTVHIIQSLNPQSIGASFFYSSIITESMHIMVLSSLHCSITKPGSGTQIEKNGKLLSNFNGEIVPQILPFSILRKSQTSSFCNIESHKYFLSWKLFELYGTQTLIVRFYSVVNDEKAIWPAASICKDMNIIKNIGLWKFLFRMFWHTKTVKCWKAKLICSPLFSSGIPELCSVIIKWVWDVSQTI